MSYWAVAQCESQREKLAAEFLKQKSYEVYLPKIRFKQSGKQRVAPLFPGYLFVEVVSLWSPIRWTIGIVKVLMSGEHPAHVPDDLVARIRQREGKDGFVRLPKSGLQLGQFVRVTKGAMAGQVGVFEGMSGAERSRILLELLGRKVTVELPSQDIVAMETVTTA